MIGPLAYCRIQNHHRRRCAECQNQQKNRPFMWIAWSPAVVLCTTRSKKLWFLRRLAHVAVPAALPDCRTVIFPNTRQLYRILGLSGLPSPSNFTQIVLNIASRIDGYPPLWVRTLNPPVQGANRKPRKG